jgi:hypothetical protein
MEGQILEGTGLPRVDSEGVDHTEGLSEIPMKPENWTLPPNLLKRMDGWTSMEIGDRVAHFYGYADALHFYLPQHGTANMLVFAVSGEGLEGCWWSIMSTGEIIETRWERGFQVLRQVAENFDEWLWLPTQY